MSDSSYDQGEPARPVPPYQAAASDQPETRYPSPAPSPAQYQQAPYQQPVAAMPYGGGQMMVAAKSPGVSLLASFFIPGLGSMINGDVGKGIGILIGYFVSLVLVIVLIGIIGVIGFWIWGMVDAYQGAKLWNARHGIIS
jgi:TM2 domain-containing membrane protein YozV